MSATGRQDRRAEGGLSPPRQEEIRLVDLPGTYGLTAISEEERIARDYIIRERPDVVIMVANAAAIDRNLYLLAELLALPAPVDVALNMMDVAAAEGVDVAAERSRRCAWRLRDADPRGAQRGARNADLRRAGAGGSSRIQPCPPRMARRRSALERSANWSARVRSSHTREWLALKLLEGDQEIVALTRVWLPAAEWRPSRKTSRGKRRCGPRNRRRPLSLVDRMVKASVRRTPPERRARQSGSTIIALHPVMGMAMLFLDHGADLRSNIRGRLAASTHARNGRHRAYAELARSLLSAWRHNVLSHFVSDAVLGGAGLVLTFLPLLLVFYAIFGFLEDTGYLARVAYLTDRFMQRIGLHGKSFLPFCLGFGCNVPAIMGARVIESRRDACSPFSLRPLSPAVRVSPYWLSSRQSSLGKRFMGFLRSGHAEHRGAGGSGRRPQPYALP